MDFKSINIFWDTGTCIAYAIWSILVVVLLIGLVTKNWILLKRTLKYFINSSVFIIAWMMFVELALVVRPHMTMTKESSIKVLKNWIIEAQIKDIYVALAAIIILFIINLLFYFKVEHTKFKRDLLILTITDSIILSLGIWLTGQEAYFGLLPEINLHFR
ncbi:MAG: hypothetical protein EOP45_23555 [Sphingobacteriaceae bacterium]|nr:MAG: hypothetical protein EOP45_23555 [Sphingobacteriaceae bacterium]